MAQVALLNAADLAKKAAGAIETKKTGIDAIRSKTRKYVKTFQARKSVSTDLKKRLGISPQDAPHVKTPPAIPTGVKVLPNADGINVLTWKRGTNTPVTNFIIEAQYPGENQFSVIGNVTATKFVHTGQTPGVTVYYRVRASRHGMLSQPSIPVVAYKTQNPRPCAPPPCPRTADSPPSVRERGCLCVGGRMWGFGRRKKARMARFLQEGVLKGLPVCSIGTAPLCIFRFLHERKLFR